MTIDRFGILINGHSLLKFYALIIILGAAAAGYLASVLAKRRGHDPEIVWDALFWMLLAGIVGARLWHILTPPDNMVKAGYDAAYYLNFNHWVPVDILSYTISLPAALATPNGGLGIPGAVMGGALALYLYTRAAKLNFAEWMDIAAPCLALGQAIGRWANFVNEELYGKPTTLPWGIDIDAAHRLPGYTDPALRFHPLFLYESLGTLLICVGLLYLSRRLAAWLKTGDLILMYLIAYPALRFCLEFLRLDSSLVFGVNINQMLMLVVGVAAGIWLVLRHRRLRRHQLKSESQVKTEDPA
jgi:phosphatidylglycerol:prolipoprotein diacylglycerol transferase